MNKVTIKGINDIFETAALSHPQVAEYKTGPTHEISEAGNSKPTLVFLEMPYLHRQNLPGANQSGGRTYSLAVLFLDIPIKGDNQDRLNSISRCDMISGYFFSYLLQNHENDLTVLDIDTVTLEDYDGDDWAGVRAEFQVQTRLPFDGCDAEAL